MIALMTSEAGANQDARDIDEHDKMAESQPIRSG